VELYLNTKVRELPRPGHGGWTFSKSSFHGHFSLENRYMVLNPANHAVGLTLYLEPRFSR